jgi:hypothetical protein
MVTPPDPPFKVKLSKVKFTGSILLSPKVPGDLTLISLDTTALAEL